MFIYDFSYSVIPRHIKIDGCYTFLLISDVLMCWVLFSVDVFH